MYGLYGMYWVKNYLTIGIQNKSYQRLSFCHLELSIPLLSCVFSGSYTLQV